jgi:hypothetical protein
VGFLLELWSWIDSWGGQSDKKRLVSSILLKSRKRDLTLAFTSQSLNQITSRIRNVTDLVAYPMMSADDSYCRIEIFKGAKPSLSMRINPPLYFNTYPVYACYDTYEEIRPIDETGSCKEMFLPIELNPAWKKYCTETLGMNNAQFIKESRDMQRAINPDNIKSENQRKKQEVFNPV